MKKLLSISILIIISAIAALNLRRPEKPVIRETYSLGTVIRISAWGTGAGEAVQQAISRIEEIDSEMSAQSPVSDIGRLNRPSVISPGLSDETIYVIKKALYYSEITEGSFDPTIGPIVELWGIGTDRERLPSPKEISEKLKLVNYRDITVTDKRVTPAAKGQMLDLGGIAKGYAADQVVEILKRQGVKSALIDLGGNIYTLGVKPDGTRWNIGIQNPYSPRGEYLGVLSTSSRSVVTSGNYERYFELDGTRYHHIFDPRTGYPSESGLSSVTIVSKKSIDGDALSTSVYVMGLERGMKLIESLQGIEAIMVKDRTVYLSSGLQGFSLKGEDFSLDQRR